MVEKGTIIRPEDRAAWLAARRDTLGASEAAIPLGLDPYTSSRGLYLRKIGVLPETEPTLAMRIGLAMEPTICALYEEGTGNEVVAQQISYRGGGYLSFLSATLDGMTAAGYPIEFKTLSARKASEVGEAGSDDLPNHWLIQAHQQMLLSKTDQVDFAVLIGNEAFRVFKVLRNEAILNAMLPRLLEFWACVQRREAPPDSHPADHNIMHLLYPGCEGEIDLGEDRLHIIEDWENSKVCLKLWEQEVEGYRQRILEALGNAASGRLPDGRIVTRKLIEVPAATIERKAYTRIDLRLKAPKGEMSS